MNEPNHIVSGIYTSRAEADAVALRLRDEGVLDEQMHIAENVPESGNRRSEADDGKLKDMLVDGAVGAAVGTGVGVLAEVALVAANVSLFIASPLIAPLAMLGWGASLGGLVGAAVGSDKTTAPGKFSDLVLDAIRSGHVVLVVHTRSATEAALVRQVVGDSLL